MSVNSDEILAETALRNKEILAAVFRIPAPTLRVSICPCCGRPEKHDIIVSFGSIRCAASKERQL